MVRGVEASSEFCPRVAHFRTPLWLGVFSGAEMVHSEWFDSVCTALVPPASRRYDDLVPLSQVILVCGTEPPQRGLHARF